MSAVSPRLLRWLRGLGLGALLIVLVVVMVRREQELESTVHLIVEANRKIGWLRPIWSDVNVWMLARPDGLSADDLADPWGGEWLRERVPWFRGARAVAAPDVSLGRSLTFDWDGRSQRSIRLYQTLEQSLYDFHKFRLGRSEVVPWSIRVEQLGIDGAVERRFAEQYGEKLGTTLYAASWHAEAMRAFLEDGDVAAASPWLHDVYDAATSEVLPAGHAYALLGLLTGQLREEPDEDAEQLRVEPTGDDMGRPQIAIVRDTTAIASQDASLEALASDERGTVRILVVRHQSTPVPDDDPLVKGLGLKLDMTIRGLPAGSFRLRFASVGAPSGSRWDGARASPLKWISGCRSTGNGQIALANDFPVPANAVLLFEVIPDPACTR